MSGGDFLYTEERGTGFPLVLLHGNGESGAYFARQIACFSAYFHVIAVDTRGHGRSPRGDAPFTLDQFAADLKALFDARGIQKAHLLGFSDGGNIALLFALRFPERVETLILSGANLSPAGVRASVQVPVVLGYSLATLLAPFSKKAASQRELLGLMVKEPHIPPAALGALCMPVLVLAGTRDMIRDAHTRAIAAAIPGAELRILEGDHFLAAKNSAAFNEAVLAFLLHDPRRKPVNPQETNA